MNIPPRKASRTFTGNAIITGTFLSIDSYIRASALEVEKDGSNRSLIIPYIYPTAVRRAVDVRQIAHDRIDYHTGSPLVAVKAICH